MPHFFLASSGCPFAGASLSHPNCRRIQSYGSMNHISVKPPTAAQPKAAVVSIGRSRDTARCNSIKSRGASVETKLPGCRGIAVARQQGQAAGARTPLTRRFSQRPRVLSRARSVLYVRTASVKSAAPIFRRQQDRRRPDATWRENSSVAHRSRRNRRAARARRRLVAETGPCELVGTTAPRSGTSCR